MIKQVIDMLVKGINLSEEQMRECIKEVMEGKVTDAQIGAFLTALRIKGETVDEIVGAAKVMREKSAKIKAPAKVIDTCGTGGDRSNTFNISTIAAIVVSACGVPVAKHGNRSVSSRSGSADLLEALGVKIDLEPEKVQKCLYETNFGFLFAPIFHPAMKYAIKPRREIGIRTIFNILGPLTNPAGARRQILGVFSDKLIIILSKVLAKLGVEDAMVFHGADGLDEITITGITKVIRYKNGNFQEYVFSPEDFGFTKSSIDDIIGGTPEDNAEITKNILKGKKGPKRDIVLMNAAVSLLVAGITENIKEAVQIAEESIDSGKALKKLSQIIEFTNSQI